MLSIMIQGACDIKTRHFSLKVLMEELFVIRRPRWKDGAKFGYKENGCGMFFIFNFTKERT